MRRREFITLVGGSAVVWAFATIAWPALADDYPNKPIRIISDSAPGSAVSPRALDYESAGPPSGADETGAMMSGG
jgi:hypothetical protein